MGSTQPKIFDEESKKTIGILNFFFFFLSFFWGGYWVEPCNIYAYHGMQAQIKFALDGICDKLTKALKICTLYS